MRRLLLCRPCMCIYRELYGTYSPMPWRTVTCQPYSQWHPIYLIWGLEANEYPKLGANTRKPIAIWHLQPHQFRLHAHPTSPWSFIVMTITLVSSIQCVSEVAFLGFFGHCYAGRDWFQDSQGSVFRFFSLSIALTHLPSMPQQTQLAQTSSSSHTLLFSPPEIKYISQPDPHVIWYCQKGQLKRNIWARLDQQLWYAALLSSACSKHFQNVTMYVCLSTK